MAKFAVLVPVGPGSAEVARLDDLLDSLWTYEPETRWLVLLDDERPERRLLERLDVPASCGAVSLAAPSRPAGLGKLGGLCSAALLGLSWIRSNTDAAFVVRLDTDALVIAPFARQLTAAFHALPQVGMAGSFDRTCNGETRDFSPHHDLVTSLARPLLPSPRRRKIRDIVRTALANGYEPGEHCLGAACAISGEMLRRMAALGCLDDPLLWRRTLCPDDVMMGIYTRAVGLRSISLTADGEPFGLKYIGLADTPVRLLERGFSLIHSVKNDALVSEATIRRFYRGRRIERRAPTNAPSAQQP